MYGWLKTDREKEALETLVPELADSEDERIRKELIEFIKWSVDRHFMREDFHQAKRPSEWIAYLEKQKEQKSLNISAASEWLRKHICNYMNSEYNEFHQCVEYDGSIDKERLINDFEEAMQEEEEPINESNMHEPTVDEARKWNEAYEKGYSLGYENGRNEQKPVEWSKEDDLKLGALITDIETRSDLTEAIKIKYVSFLMSLRQQPKQEWSEEDEAHRKFILESLEDQIRFCKKDAEGAYYAKQIRTAQNWLNDLPNKFRSEKK